MVLALIFKKRNLNYNTYCIEIPPNYKPITWSLDEFVEMGEDPKKSEEKVVRKNVNLLLLLILKKNQLKKIILERALSTLELKLLH